MQGEFHKCSANEIAAHYITKDMYHAILKVMLLNMISMHQTHAYGLLKHVSRLVRQKHIKFGTNIKSDVYNTVTALESAGYIRARGGGGGEYRAKKCYTITPKGRAAIRESRKVFAEATKAINEIVTW